MVVRATLQLGFKDPGDPMVTQVTVQHLDAALKEWQVLIGKKEPLRTLEQNHALFANQCYPLRNSSGLATEPWI